MYIRLEIPFRRYLYLNIFLRKVNFKINFQALFFTQNIYKSYICYNHVTHGALHENIRRCISQTEHAVQIHLSRALALLHKVENSHGYFFEKKIHRSGWFSTNIWPCIPNLNWTNNEKWHMRWFVDDFNWLKNLPSFKNQVES